MLQRLAGFASSWFHS